MRPRYPTFRVPACIVLLALVGCNGLNFIWGREENKTVDLGVAPTGSSAASAALRDTIGAQTYLEGMSPMRVRGYGLVLGLGRQGSTECPKSIFQELVRTMYQQHSFSSREVGVKSTTPEEMINSLDSAVVVVYGQISAGAVAGTSLDVTVRALSGTQTRSLRGGTLFPTDLEVFRELDGRGIMSGQPFARAAGPILVNPFADGQMATDTTALEGIVMDGARVVKDRTVRLVLIKPSHQAARIIQERINTRFTASGTIANAISPSFVVLTIPREFKHNVAHFLGLVRGLYRTTSPRLDTVRAQKLARAIVHPSAPHADLSLSFEGLGTTALPVLKKLYDHEQPHANYHAAVAGLRLGDHMAGDVISRHAKDPGSEYRFQAIRALGEARDIGATGSTLRDLLQSDDPRVRVAAYEALVERKDAVIHSTVVGHNNFVLDIVPCDPPNVIYAKRSGARRIALFGLEMACKPPLFYRSPNGRLTITAQPDDDGLTLLRRLTETGSTSPPLSLPFDLARLIVVAGREAQVERDGSVVGLGLNYGEIVRALCFLCEDRSINASFMLQQPNVAELFGPPKEVGRSESEF